jgi:hypothetical protein
MNKVKKLLFIGLIFFAVVFSTYQVFLAPTKAAYLTCGTQPCTTVLQDCSGTIECTCVKLFGYGPVKCYFGAVVYDE